MPPHIALFNLDGTAASAFAVELSAGEESAVITREIWNDKNSTEPGTTTAQSNVLKLLVSYVVGYTSDDPPLPIYGTYDSDGTPLLDERWGRVRITHTLTAAGASTSGATGTLPFGVNADLPLPDLEPQTGVRFELYFATPGGQSYVDPVHIALNVIGNMASSPLAPMTTLATGSGVVPAERIAGLRALLRGSEVTADDTDTVTIGRGQQVVDGVVITTPETSMTFDLADAGAVDLAAGESYRVTLSRAADGTVTATKGVKANVLTYPDAPAGEPFVANLTVASADGVSVTVAPASVQQAAVRYAQQLVRAGAGLTVIVSAGVGVTSTDFRQNLSHQSPLAVAASSTSRIWRLADGTLLATLTDTEPEIGADLLALAPADAVAVTNASIIDKRRFAHRAVTEWREVLTYRGVLSAIAEPSPGLAWAILPEGEIERVTMDLSDVDASYTAGNLAADVMIFAPGAPVPFPAGGAGGVSLFSSSATDDRRPSIAFDATNLQAVTEDHEVRRVVAGTRALLTIVTTFAAPAPEPEQEVRLTLHMRRYR